MMYFFKKEKNKYQVFFFYFFICNFIGKKITKIKDKKKKEKMRSEVIEMRWNQIKLRLIQTNERKRNYYQWKY